MTFAAIGRAGLAQCEALMGIVPGGGGTQYLMHRMGRHRALEAVLGASLFDADTAARYGWVNRALPADELDEFVERLARDIAALPDGVVAAAKAAMPAADLSTGFAREHAAWQGLFVRPAAEMLIRGGLAAGAQTLDGERRLEGRAARCRQATGRGRDGTPDVDPREGGAASRRTDVASGSAALPGHLRHALDLDEQLRRGERRHADARQCRADRTEVPGEDRHDLAERVGDLAAHAGPQLQHVLERGVDLFQHAAQVLQIETLDHAAPTAREQSVSDDATALSAVAP